MESGNKQRAHYYSVPKLCLFEGNKFNPFVFVGKVLPNKRDVPRLISLPHQEGDNGLLLWNQPLGVIWVLSGVGAVHLFPGIRKVGMSVLSPGHYNRRPS